MDGGGLSETGRIRVRGNCGHDVKYERIINKNLANKYMGIEEIKIYLKCLNTFLKSDFLSLPRTDKNQDPGQVKTCYKYHMWDFSLNN